MAVTLDQSETLAFDKIVSFPIEKSRTTITADGDMYVYGKCTDGRVDSDEQIVDPDWSADALDKWFKTGANVRKQHNARDPVGKGIHLELDRDNDGGHWLRAEVVDRDAQRLVKKGVLQAFSVGIMKPKIFAHNKARGGIIKGGDIGEVSLVDRPANSDCGFSLVKAAGGVAGAEPEYIGKLRGDEEILRKMLAPSPADMPKHLPAVAQGAIPDMIPSGMFASPVSNRLNDALRAEDMLLKRDFSASQRRSAASSGDAMPDGSFPIKNSEDLGNAIHLAGHGKNPAAARAHIRSRASALGMSDRIPDSWKSDGTTEIIDDLMTGLTEELVKQITEGVTSIDEARKQLGLPDPDEDKARGSTCPDCHGSGMMGDKTCPNCASGMRKQDEDPDAEKGMCPPPDASAEDSDDDDDDDDKKGKAAAPSASNSSKRPRNIRADASSGGPPAANVTDASPDDDHASAGGRNYRGNKSAKVKKYACSACGCKADKSASYCPGCGAEFAGKAGDPAAGVKAKPGTKRTPSEDEKNRDDQLGSMGWPGTTGEGSDRGSAIMSGSGTAGVGDGNSTTISARKGAAPYAIIRAHDAFCAAYSQQVVLDEYPSLSKLADAVDPADLRETATKALTDGDFDLSEALLAVARNAADILKQEDEVIEDAHAELHKGFQDMYPNAHPTPGSVSPGMFQRPYLSAGHAPGSAQPMGQQPPAHEPPPSPSAGQFTRGPLTTGEQRPSPGNTKDQARPAPGRHFYTNSAKTSTRTAMQAVHDHISSMYPDLCPLHAGTPLPSAMAKGDGVSAELDLQSGIMTPEDVSKAVRDALTAAGYGVTDANPTGAYSPEGMPEVQQGRPVASLVKARNKKKAAFKQDAFRAEQLAELLKAANAPVAEALASLQAAVTSKDDQISELEKQVAEQGSLIDKLGSLPDPAQAPNRGIVLSASSASPGGARPAERRSLVDEAAVKAREDKLRFLQSFTQSGDPSLRLQAEEQINKMLSAQ